MNDEKMLEAYCECLLSCYEKAYIESPDFAILIKDELKEKSKELSTIICDGEGCSNEMTWYDFKTHKGFCTDCRKAFHKDLAEKNGS